MYDLHKLRVLRELKHRGTLAEVARALSYSPSSISQQLSQLETEVGSPLLEPVGRRVRLTAQAEILVSHTDTILKQLEVAEADVASSLTTIGGTVRIAAFQTAALTLIPQALDRMRAVHPNLRVHVTQLEPELALPALQARDFDLVIAEEYPGNPNPRPAGLEAEDLLEDPLHLAMPRGTRDPIDTPDLLGSLADHPWVMEPVGTTARHWAMTLCRTAGIEPDVRFESTDLLVHIRLVERGHAVALVPNLAWNGQHPKVSVHRLPPGHQARRIFTMVRHGSSQHPTIRACRDALKEAAAEVRHASPDS